MRARPRPFSSGGASIPMVMTVRLVSGHRGKPIVTDPHLGLFGLRASREANRYRLPLGSFGLGGSRGVNRYSLPLGSFGLGASREPIVTACHWVRLVSGLRGSQSLQLAIGFVWSRGLAGGQSLQIAIGFVWSRGFAGANRYSLPLGSFGLGASREPIVTACHWVRGSCPQDVGPPPQSPPQAGCRSGVASLHSRGCRPTPRPRPEPVPSSGQHLGDMSRVRLVSGLRGSQSLQIAIGFVWSRGFAGANRYRLPLGSFGREDRLPALCFLDQILHSPHFTQFS